MELQHFVGSHSTCNIADGYLGSGIALQNAIKKYGSENFKCDVLENFPTKEEAFRNETIYIEKLNTVRPNGYNISPTGGPHLGGLHSEHTKNLLRAKRSGVSTITENGRKKISEVHKGKVLSKETRQKISKNWVHKELSEESRRSIGIKGTQNRVFTQEYRDKISKANKEIVHTEEWNNKVKEGLSKQPKRTCPHCGDVCQGSNQTRWHFDKCKKRILETTNNELRYGT